MLRPTMFGGMVCFAAVVPWAAASRGDDGEEETTFRAAVAAPAEAAYQTVVVSERQTIASDLTVPFNVALKFENGGVLKVAEEATLTINGSIDAPMQPIFEGPGRVVLGPGRVKEVYPQWWGARGDGEHDDTASIQAAINAVPAGVVFFPPGVYANTGVQVQSSILLKGAGIGATALRFTPTEGSCLTLPPDCTWFRLEDLSLVAPANTSGCGIDGTQEYVRHFSLRNFLVSGFKTGIYIPAGMHLSFDYGYVSCYGMGEANGSVGLKLGDKARDKGCTTATVQNVYFTNAETCFYNRAAPCVMIRPIFETCQIGLDSYTRATVIGPFFAGYKQAAARMTDNGVFFVGPYPTEHTFLYADETVRNRTSFFPDTFDSPMKLGLLEMTAQGEMTVAGKAVGPE